MAFASDGRMYVWERGGRIWHVDANGVKSAQPVCRVWPNPIKFDPYALGNPAPASKTRRH